MARKSVTLSVTTSSASYNLPTDNDHLVALKNISENAIWISHLDGVDAEVEADENEVILAGETVYITWKATLVAIAVDATSKLVATNALGRL